MVWARSAYFSRRSLSVLSPPLVCFAAGLLVLILGLGLLWYKGAGQPYNPKSFSYSANTIASDDLYDQSTQRYLGERYSSGRFYVQVLSSRKAQATIRTALTVHALNGETLAGINTQRLISTNTGQFLNTAGRPLNDYLFAPANLRNGQDFSDSYVLYNRPAQARYVGQETIYGLQVYHYRLNYPNSTDLTAPGIPTHNLGSGNTATFQPNVQLWIEPATGWLIKVTDHTNISVTNKQSGAFVRPYDVFSATYTDASIHQQVAYAANLRNQAVFSEHVAPSCLCVLLFIVLFFVYIRRLHTSEAFIRIVFGGLGTAIFAVLAGWSFHYTPFLTFFMGSVGINPLVALDFAIVLISLVYIREIRWLSMVLGFALAVVNQVAILGLLHITGFRLDEVIARTTILNMNSVTPSQMSLHEAGMFILLGLCIALISYRRGPIARKVCGFLASIVIVFNIFCILIQFLQINALFSLSLLYPLSAAASLMFCGVGYLLLLTILPSTQATLQTNGRIARQLVRPAILVLPLFVGVIIMQFRQNVATDQLRASFMRRTAIISSQMTERVHIYEATLLGTQALFAASHDVEASEWQAFVSDFTHNSFTKGIESVGYAPVVAPDSTAYGTAMQSSRTTPVAIFPKTSDHTLTPVQYINPQTAANDKQIGYDLSSNAVIAVAIGQAGRTDTGVITGTIRLGDLPGGRRQAGFIMFEPIYKHGLPISTAAERQAATQGYVFAVIGMRDLVQSAIGKEYATIEFQAYNGYLTNPEHILYDSRKGYTAGKYVPAFSGSSTITVLSQPWTISYEALPAFNTANEQTTWLNDTVVAGSIVYLLGVAGVYLIVTYRQQVRSARRRLHIFKRHHREQ